MRSDRVLCFLPFVLEFCSMSMLPWRFWRDGRGLYNFWCIYIFLFRLRPYIGLAYGRWGWLDLSGVTIKVNIVSCSCLKSGKIATRHGAKKFGMPWALHIWNEAGGTQFIERKGMVEPALYRYDILMKCFPLEKNVSKTGGGCHYWKETRIFFCHPKFGGLTYDDVAWKKLCAYQGMYHGLPF